MDAISNESNKSTRLRLLYEVIQWEAFHAEDLEAINLAIVAKAHGRKIVALTELYLICLLEANILNSFKEKFYVFDEDEKEIRRQLRFSLFTHLTIITILALLVPTLVGKLTTLVIYCGVTAYWGTVIFLPVFKQLTKNFRR